MTANTRVVPASQGVEIQAEYHFDAPQEKVFSFFSVHENLMQVFGGKIRLSQAATGEDPNGLGSVRTIKIGPGPSFDERIERFDAPDCIEYTITRGSPVKNHYGRMTFSADGTGTKMDYSIQLQGRMPGTSGIIGKVMARTLAQGLPRAEKIIQAT